MPQKTWTLKQPKQCKTCPWRAETTTDQIPNYEESLHRGLESTIAADQFDRSGRVMACHNSTDEDERYCIGWLVNQIGPGNNIGMRLRLRSCSNAGDIETVGEQVRSFEETFK